MPVATRLPRKRCRCGAWMVFVRMESKLGKCFPINAEASDGTDPLATLGRVWPHPDGLVDVVRYVEKSDRDKYRFLYVPHHVTCPDRDSFKYRDRTIVNTPATEYQAELDGLRDWRVSRNRD